MDIAAFVVSCLALLVSAGSVWIASRQTKAAEQQTEVALQGVDDTRKAAARAERIAEHANQLAQDANELSRRAMRGQLDQQGFDWLVQCEGDLGKPVGVVLHGARPVGDVTVFVTDSHGRVAQAHADEVAPLARLDVELGAIWDEHLKEVLDQRGRPAISDGYLFSAGSPPPSIELRLSYVVGYRTDAGVLRTGSVEHQVRHRRQGNGVKVVERP